MKLTPYSSLFFFIVLRGSHLSLQLIPMGSCNWHLFSVTWTGLHVSEALAVFSLLRDNRCLSSGSATKMVPMALSGHQVLLQIRCWASPLLAPLRSSACSHFLLPLPTPTVRSLPTASTGLGYCQRKAVSCWVPPAHIYSGRSVFLLTWSQPKVWD